ncbi:hypothetical protein LMG19083_04677 [Ralstonia psammae]|uniref:DUF2968 domain-containing protein n=1 Tax=Ralstonia psammae TaxID=3058598 RepID=A0ABN9JG53_9RALS|nr:hypothetical protein LMG19083_04677 [Ralstonia sp. LMG 19083]
MMPNDKQSTAGNVVELQQMLHGPDLNELRTTYNGTYGASLLFYSKNMTYYIALFQQKNFWRVIKSQDATRAETIYKDFVRQTVQLSDVEIRRTQLAAQKAFTERLTAFSHDQANRLQADLDVERQQQTIVASQQQQSRGEAMALAQQKAAAQDRLRSAQRQVSELQRQMEIGLPSHCSCKPKISAHWRTVPPHYRNLMRDIYAASAAVLDSSHHCSRALTNQVS